MNRIETIASGEFFVTNKTDISAQAFLGSCVGLAILDTEAEVGGIYHILLPEPSSKISVPDPKKYALTGLPLFLQELEKTGARRENMKAYLGGGALMGDVSDIDLAFDFGGRTTELVEKFLTENKIELVQEETGGYFGYKMTVDFLNFKVDLSLTGSNFMQRRKHDVIPELEDIDSVIQKIKPIPQIALKVIRMIHSSEVSMATIGEEIRQDQVLTAKIINLCNSAYFNPKNKIDNIDQAVVMLGERRILLLTFSIFTEYYYKDADNGYSLCKGGLFQHALGVAKAAEEIARETKKIEVELAYTAGLLHDIGKIVLDQWVDHFYPMFYRNLYNDQNLSLVDVERKVFQIDHTEAGAKLAKLWDLPERLAYTIEFHHQLDKYDAYPYLMHIINLANLLVSSFKAGLVLTKFEEKSLMASVQHLGLDSNQILHILERIPFNNLHSFSEKL
ncbi:MAG: HDOD domain-containing protein [Caldisericaceae bacterium]|nr:HDOD domain-containing protein [Caldisericaceae bacterium]